MQIETPPTEKPYDKAEGERRGIIIVNTGDGKGKSTAAFGLALRAHGRGKAVKIFQFMKVPSARFGEHRMFEQLGVPILGLGDGFSWRSRDLEHSAQLARDGWQKAKAAILGGDFFMVTLDEVTYPLIYGWLPLDDVLETLEARPSHVHVVLTGRRCPPEIIALADTVTEMQMVNTRSRPAFRPSAALKTEHDLQRQRNLLHPARRRQPRRAPGCVLPLCRLQLVERY